MTDEWADFLSEIRTSSTAEVFADILQILLVCISYKNRPISAELKNTF